MTTLRTEWECYRQDMLPPDAPEIQVWETELAFFAGAWAVLVTMVTLGRPGIPQHIRAEVLQRLYDECHAFGHAVDVKTGVQ